MLQKHAWRMELRHLRYFIAVAEEENITRAAARLHVTQPSVSRQIRDLECKLEVDLLEHSSRSVKLTAAGRHFLDEAKEVVARLESAVASVKNFAHGGARELHVGYAPSVTTEVLPRLLRRFQTRYPLTKIKLWDRSSNEMMNGLQKGDLHVALLMRPMARELEGLEFREISRFRPCVAMPIDHPLTQLTTIRPVDLLEYPLLAYSREEYPEYHVWLERIMKKAPKRPPIAGEFDSFSSLIAAIESGCGMAIIQQGFEASAGQRVTSVPLKTSKNEDFSLGVAIRKGNRDPLCRAFVSEVLEAMSQSEF